MSDKRDNERVSKAYRDIASERPAAHLDARILKDARAAATPRYAHLRTWTRPLAWAATIGLSLAIVLQVTEQPVVEAPAAVQPASDTVLESVEDKRQDQDITQQLRKEGAAWTAKPERVEEAFTPNMEMLREAENVGRMKASRAQLGAEPEAATALSDATAIFCDEDARASAESWLECIAKLEDEQKDEAARLERAAFDAAYPDAETP
jgi:hypothetical protein